MQSWAITLASPRLRIATPEAISYNRAKSKFCGSVFLGESERHTKLEILKSGICKPSAWRSGYADTYSLPSETHRSHAPLAAAEMCIPLMRRRANAHCNRG